MGSKFGAGFRKVYHAKSTPISTSFSSHYDVMKTRSKSHRGCHRIAVAHNTVVGKPLRLFALMSDRGSKSEAGRLKSEGYRPSGVAFTTWATPGGESSFAVQQAERTDVAGSLRLVLVKLTTKPITSTLLRHASLNLVSHFLILCWHVEKKKYLCKIDPCDNYMLRLFRSVI